MGETIVVIGANHADTAAINTILDQFPENRVIAFDGNSNASFLGYGVAFQIGRQISGPEGLFYSSREAFEGKGAVIRMETEISRVDYDKKVVYDRGKDEAIHEQPCDRLILATGSLPIRPKLQGMGLENVQFVELYQNAWDVIQELKDPSIRRIAVMGAGYIEVELAGAFVRNGREIALIDCADTCLAGYYDSEFSYIIGKNLESHGVELTLGETVVKLEGRKKIQIVITDQARYQVDMAIFGIGFKPNTGLGQGRLKLFKNGTCLVDHKRETSVAGVYAIGDCATAYNNAVQATDYIALTTNAVHSDVIAAHNARGRTFESVGVQGSNGISIWGFHMLCTDISLKGAQEIGYTAASSDYEDWQETEFMENGNNKVKIRIIYDKETKVILGAQICPDYDISMGMHLFSMAIEEQVTTDRLRLFDLFFLPHFNKPCNYITMVALATQQSLSRLHQCRHQCQYEYRNKSFLVIYITSG